MHFHIILKIKHLYSLSIKAKAYPSVLQRAPLFNQYFEFKGLRLPPLQKTDLFFGVVTFMAYVITSRCNDCKYTYCAAVCPVDAFHEADHYLLINPESCIDCNACQSECPVGAIYPEEDVPKEEESSIYKNKIESLHLPVIRSVSEPLRGPKCVDPNAD